ncbi:hypothetical protein Y10_07850 [Neptunitalea sp. Y10]|uniref:Uncharacterized protein n=1 Tax=Neptunitalea lumnitzerae TaxID=2965509 RepID=A0ABQ5MHK1_9FLAO|nr:hypothetical protein Y10_07850 [Neptunitalea sp. Y10]
MILYIYLFFEVLVYVLLTIYLFKLLLKDNKIVVSVIYFAVLWFFAEVFNQVHILLREHSIYVELGHGSIINILILLIFHIIGFSVILYRIKSK